MVHAMICNLLKFVRDSSYQSWLWIAILATGSLSLGGCAGGVGGGNYHTTAYQPVNTSAVRVKVSLHTQNVYVEEGNRLLMATPTCVGRPGFETPTGHFAVTDKIRDKRSSTYGYWLRGSEAHPGESSHPPAGGGWHYVGYPMAFWVEFTPGYGFHEGPIWPFPKSHGCLHIHETASAKLFELVHVGTPVEIEETLPEDSEYHVDRPNDYTDPDPPAALMTSPEFFDKPRDTQLLAAPSTPSA
jgi:hypothetical protein